MTAASKPWTACRKSYPIMSQGGLDALCLSVNPRLFKPQQTVNDDIPGKGQIVCFLGGFFVGVVA